jgi:hypothetical protein
MVLPWDKVPGKRYAHRRFYRLRIAAEINTPDGVYPPVRDVYLESSLCPLTVDGRAGLTYLGDAPGNVECVMMNCGVAIDRVLDLIRYLDRDGGMVIIYEPPGNMAGHLHPKPNGQTSLFE